MSICMRQRRSGVARGGKTRWRERVNVVPHVVCDACRRECELDNLIVNIVPVVAFRANYAGTWIEAVRPVSSRDPLFTATLKTEDTFDAIRPLDEARLVP